MVTPKVSPPPNVVEKNILLTGEVMRYLLNKPEVFNALPDKFELVILPEDDPEMRLYNLELLDQFTGADKTVVLARIKTRQEATSNKFSPSLFVPVSFAA